VNAHRLWYSFALLLLSPVLAALAADKDQYGDPLPDGAKARMGTARLRQLSYSSPILTPDGKSLYAQTNSGIARLDPASGAVQGQAPAQLFSPPTIISADGKRAVYVSYNSVTVSDIDTGKSFTKVERRLPTGEIAASISADGKTLAIGGTGDQAKKETVTVLVWDVDNDKERKKINVVQNNYAGVALSGDGKTLATWGAYYDPTAKTQPDPNTDPNRFVTFWDATTGKELAKFRVAGFSPGTVMFSPDGSLVAVANNNSSIDLVDPKTGTSKQLLLGRSQMGRWIAFSPDGTTVAAASDRGAVQRWKVTDGTRLSTTEAPVPNLYNTRIRMLSADKGMAWAAKGSAVVVWDIPSGKLISPEGGHTSPIRGLAVTPDNKYVITSAEDSSTLKWDLATGKPVGPVTFRTPSSNFGGYMPAAIFSPDVTRAILRDSGGLAVYDMTNGTEQYIIPTPIVGFSYGAFSSDGSKVVIASASYDAKKTPAHVSVWDVAKAKQVVSLELPGYSTLSAAITPDGKHIVTAGRKAAEKGNGDFIIAAWDSKTGAKKGEYTEEAGYAMQHVTPAPDNKTAAVVTSKGALVVFDLASGKIEKTFDLNRHQAGLAPLFSQDGKKLAVACQADFGPNQPAAILVLDWPSGEVKQTFTSPGGTPGAIVFSPDGKWLVTAGQDTTATVWELSK